MVHLFDQNENKLEFYEKIRNEFVYRALVFMEYFQASYDEYRKKCDEQARQLEKAKSDLYLANAKIKSQEQDIQRLSEKILKMQRQGFPQHQNYQ